MPLFLVDPNEAFPLLLGAEVARCWLLPMELGAVLTLTSGSSDIVPPDSSDDFGLQCKGEEDKGEEDNKEEDNEEDTCSFARLKT